MDPIRLGRQLAQGGMHKMGNVENVTLSSLPATVLEAFVPGYGIISKFINDKFGFDVSMIIAAVVFAFAMLKSATYIWTQVQTTFEQYCLSSVHIEDSDDLYGIVLLWIAEQQMTQRARAVKAKSARGGAWDEDTDEKRAAISAVDESGIFNYSRWQARVPPRFEPYYGSHRFFHKGRLFRFHRSQRQQQILQSFGRMGPQGGNSSRDEDLLELSCVGFTTVPVKDLLQEIKVWSIKKQLSRTTIRHPTSKSNSRWGGQWSKTNSRPSRPMSTVILDEEQKTMIQRDMNEFLHPSSPKWYATRGIPYRRGYLFHGPPGTGKTSLSFALAGIFGLDIHCIALNDPEMTETDLRELFNSLPRRCIVLLEDIDSAGIKRPDNEDEDDNKPKGPKSKRPGKTEGKPNGDAKETTDDEKWTLQDLARALASVSSGPGGKGPRPSGGRGKGNRMPDPTIAQQGISLSGLLNAIDGVATHEGRILIMTTNHPEKLDSALIRTGRVDMQIRFTFAKRVQIKELFMGMYVPDSLQETIHQTAFKAQGKVDGEEGVEAFKLLGLGEGRDEAMKELASIAGKFADQVPDEMFSPSDVQGFLLLHKKSPREALEKVRKWRDEEIKKREEKEGRDED